MGIATRLSAALLLLFCCSACRQSPSPASHSPGYLDPQNIALRQRAREYCDWNKTPDYQKAFDLYFQAAVNHDTLAKLAACLVRWEYLQDDSYVRTDYVRLKIAPAVKRNADKGNAEAQFLYGWYGMSTGKPNQDALKYLELAAKSGYREAFNKAGMALEMGSVTAKDRDGAVAWFQRGSAAGDSEASIREGFILADKDYPQHDFEKSYQLYMTASEQGCANAYYYLGYSALMGMGTPANGGTAVYYFQQGVDKGDRDCYYGLGKAYAEGIGVAQDYVKGRKFLEKALAMNAEGASEMLKYLDSIGR